MYNKAGPLTPCLRFFVLTLLGCWLGQSVWTVESAPASVGADWQTVIEQAGLTQRQRVGAQFAAQHLPYALFEALPDKYRDSLLRYAADHSEGHPSLVICWEEHTPEHLVKPFLEIEYAGRVLREAQGSPQNTPIGTALQASDTSHWSRTASNGSSQNVQGLPITLTWSIVPDGTIIPGGEVAGEASNEPSNLRAWLAGLYGGTTTGPAASQPWFPILQAVFDNIAAQTGMRYVYEPNDDGATLSSLSSGQGVLGVRGDVRISGHRLDGNYNVLAYNYFPDHSDMVLDTSDIYFNNTANNSRILRNVIEHEHGHGLGLRHVCPVNNTKLMEPYINTGFVGVQFDDVFTIQRLYGDFLEVHGANLNNDSFALATPLPVTVGVPYAAQWLGIDDNTDTDYFAFAAPAGSQVTVRILPSTASYLEGPQSSIDGSCSAGTTFNSGTLQNLGLTLFGPDQSTVLAAATSQPLGSPETVSNLTLASTATYYLRVTGSGANSNQLYRLEMSAIIPAIALRLVSAEVVAELLAKTNGVPDPGETVQLRVRLENIGAATASDVWATLTGPAGFQGFEVARPFGAVPSGARATNDFTFALTGFCGEAFDLSLNATANGADAGVLPLSLRLGTETTVFQEDFEAGSSLPAGWANTQSGSGALWSIASSPSNSPKQSAFAPDVGGAGQSILTTPTIVVGPDPGTLTFTHAYDTQTNRDGGVLEIRIGTSSWQDILQAGGAFVTGPYNSTLSGTQNPINGRSAWSGNSDGFITTTVTLPSAVANQSVQFRWILGCDRRTAGNGWFIEEVQLSGLACESGVPLLTLSSADAWLSEYDKATDTAMVTVSAPLPVAAPLPVTWVTSGSANPALDLTGLSDFTLPVGSARTSLVLTAVSDGLVEGNETLTLTSPEAGGSVELTLLDTPWGQFASTNLGTTGPVNPFDDFDADGSMNVEELLFASDLRSPSSRPLFHLEPDGADFKLPALVYALPVGILVEGESTTDFLQWTTDGITLLPDGVRMSGADPQRFLRLRYEVRETR
jgi:hypothetical protein